MERYAPLGQSHIALFQRVGGEENELLFCLMGEGVLLLTGNFARYEGLIQHFIQMYHVAVDRVATQVKLLKQVF